MKRHGQTTLVRPFPISVDFRETHAEPKVPDSPYVVRTALLKNLGIEASFLGIGVDRIDYTKGIIERFRGIERFLEKWPAYQGQFTFVQIGAPSRTRIQRYNDFVAEVEAEAARINARFQTPKWKPIVLLKRHHEHSEIQPYYQAADLCMVTSLHDGMNLVAKEFVAARRRRRGRADFEPVHGRQPRAARCDHRQSVRHRTAERSNLHGARNERAGAARANAAAATDGQGAQRIPVGGQPDHRIVRNPH